MKDEFLKTIRKIVPDISEMDLGVSISDTCIDSIDLVVIRDAIEKRFNYLFEDSTWFQFHSLNEVFDYLNTKHVSIKNEHTSKRVESERIIEINMPQMANGALSENWMLKELGDLHWHLLSKGLNEKSAYWKNENGERLYATFTRILYTSSPLNYFRENEIVQLKGSIKRFGNSVYISNACGMSANGFINATLMTSFSVRSSNDNTRIEKDKPKKNANYIECFENTPDLLNDYRLLKKGLIDQWKVGNCRFPIKQYSVYKHEYIVNPFYDVNGVGLLYFAAYPVIADISMGKVFNELLGNDDWLKAYQTVYRDINYFANCASDEIIVACLNNFQIINEKRIIAGVSLHRKSDDVQLTQIFTIKEK